MGVSPRSDMTAGAVVRVFGRDVGVDMFGRRVMGVMPPDGRVSVVRAAGGVCVPLACCHMPVRGGAALVLLENAALDALVVARDVMGDAPVMVPDRVVMGDVVSRRMVASRVMPGDVVPDRVMAAGPVARRAPVEVPEVARGRRRGRGWQRGQGDHCAGPPVSTYAR